jgi:hypothetical protein
MKKLIVLAAIALIGTGFADARVIRSRTTGTRTPVASTPTEWIIRTGLSINNAAGPAVGFLKYDDSDDEETDSYSVGPRCGWDLSVAFNKPLGTSGAYWGMELGLGSRGASAKSEYGWTYTDYDGDKTEYFENSKQHISTWNAKFSPFTIGYKYPIKENIKLDAHIGAFVSYDFSGSASVKWECTDPDDNETEDYAMDDYDIELQRLDAGLQIGVGVWINKFNIDLTYQRGFINASTSEYLEDDDYDCQHVYSSNLMLRVGIAF